jgi:hypothetical protein
VPRDVCCEDLACFELAAHEQNVASIPKGLMSALGQKQTPALQKAMSALLPIATVKADMPQTVMSAFPPKADMCSAARDVC